MTWQCALVSDCGRAVDRKASNSSAQLHYRSTRPNLGVLHGVCDKHHRYPLRTDEAAACSPRALMGLRYGTAQYPCSLLDDADEAAGPGPSSRSQALVFSLNSSRQQRCSSRLASLGTSAASLAQDASGLVLLPLGANRGNKRQRFAWDGERVLPVNEALLQEGYTAAGRLQDWVVQVREDIAQSFMPRRDDVTEDYWEWLRWRLGQRFFSATMQNFATQSLLMAVGVGAQKALAASAAINWMLKDGMNRLVRMGVATQFGNAFDSDLKRFRFTTSCLYTACMTCEFLTPMYPQHFLLLASISNVGRAVGLTTFVSTQPAFQQALCASGNMADLASKTQAQHMVMDTLALAVSASANYLLRHQEARRMMLPLVAFPICAVGDLFCIYRELKAVQLRTLNRERGEMITERWLQCQQVPSFADISSAESLLGAPNIAGNMLPMRLLPLERLVKSPGQLSQLMGAYKGRAYMLAYLPGEQLPWWHVERWLYHYRTEPHIAVALQEGAKPRDILMAVLEAGCLRQGVQQALHTTSLQHQAAGDSSRSSSSSSSSQPPALPVVPLTAGLVEPQLPKARRRAEQLVDKLLVQLQQQGWQTRTFLLSTAEKEGYALM